MNLSKIHKLKKEYLSSYEGQEDISMKVYSEIHIIRNGRELSKEMRAYLSMKYGGSFLMSFAEEKNKVLSVQIDEILCLEGGTSSKDPENRVVRIREFILDVYKMGLVNFVSSGSNWPIKNPYEIFEEC